MPMKISVTVKPGKRVSRIEKNKSSGSYTAFLKSQPIKGRANVELIKLIKKELGCEKAPKIISGRNSKKKLIEI
jgi:hypothetical protein